MFAFLYAAIYARMIRASVLETMDEEYVRTARAKGAGEAQVLQGHVLRNAMLPVVTMIGMDIGTALGGVIFIETVFGLPGLGGMLRGAIPSKDLPVILGVVTFTTIGILDPEPRRRSDVRDDRPARADGAGVAGVPGNARRRSRRPWQSRPRPDVATGSAGGGWC